MAREAPPVNTIYTGMLAVSVAACLIGCVIVGLEMTNDYDWATETKGGPLMTPTGKGGPMVGAQAGRAMPQLYGAAAKEKEKEAAQAANPNAELAVAPTTPAVIPPPTPQTIPFIASVPVATTPVEPLPVSAFPAKSGGIVPSPLKLPSDR